MRQFSTGFAALLTLIATALAPLVSQASKPQKPSRLDRDFIASCGKAFQGSRKEDMTDASRAICECAASENHHQGATNVAIQREVDRMRKDPRAKIEDEHVLDAFRWCTIQAMDEREAAVDSAAQ